MPFRRIFFFAAFAVSALITASGCGEKKTPQQQDTVQTARKEVQANNNTSLRANTIVHEGDIDLKAIDENKDGKVFQCQMDYNVISDYKGVCPKCGMNLEEVTLDKAKSNLKGSGFTVK